MASRDMRLKKLQLVTGVADADQAGQLDISGETRTARKLRISQPPTDAVRLTHNATHGPFAVNKTADPKFQMENMFSRTMAESKIQP